jgi:hypothetical protein
MVPSSFYFPLTIPLVGKRGGVSCGMRANSLKFEFSVPGTSLEKINQNIGIGSSLLFIPGIYITGPHGRTDEYLYYPLNEWTRLKKNLTNTSVKTKTQSPKRTSLEFFFSAFFFIVYRAIKYTVVQLTNMSNKIK